MSLIQVLLQSIVALIYFFFILSEKRSTSFDETKMHAAKPDTDLRYVEGEAGLLFELFKDMIPEYGILFLSHLQIEERILQFVD